MDLIENQTLFGRQGITRYKQLVDPSPTQSVLVFPPHTKQPMQHIRDIVLQQPVAITLRGYIQARTIGTVSDRTTLPETVTAHYLCAVTDWTLKPDLTGMLTLPWSKQHSLPLLLFPTRRFV